MLILKSSIMAVLNEMLNICYKLSSFSVKQMNFSYCCLWVSSASLFTRSCLRLASISTETSTCRDSSEALSSRSCFSWLSRSLSCLARSSSELFLSSSAWRRPTRAAIFCSTYNTRRRMIGAAHGRR